MTLEKKQLGSTDLILSRIGIGTVKFGRNEGVKYPSPFALPDDKEIVTLLETAKDLGINLIDTAPAYGFSEERIGQLLKHRSDWILTTKVGEDFSAGISTFNFSAEHINFSIERSLKNLNTDYLDIVLVHSDGNDQEIIRDSACLETLERIKQRGLIRAYGMSTKTVSGGLLAMEYCDVIMVTYNPDESQDRQVIDAAQESNKGILIKKAFNSGHALGSSEKPIDGIKRNMQFIFQAQGVTSIIIGTLNPSHLEENVNTAMRVL